MWIMLSDAFFSVVKKDCPEGHLMVRARRPGDIEKVFGRRHKVVAYTKADYHYRCAIPFDEVAQVMVEELRRVVYANFKDSVRDNDLHNAYLRVWTAMATIQPAEPYAGCRPIYPAKPQPKLPLWWDDEKPPLTTGPLDESALFDDIHDLYPETGEEDEPQSAYRPARAAPKKKGKRK